MDSYPNGGGGEEALGLAFMIGIFLIALLIGLAIQALICWLLYNVFKRVPPEHRKMSPGQVWLLMIPLFNLVWNFFVYLRLPESLQSYFASRGRTDVGDAGRTIGLWYAICAACSVIPCVNYVAGPASLVLLIIFLVKVYGLKNQMDAPAAITGPPAPYGTPPQPPAQP